MEKVDYYAKIVWDYMVLGQEIFKADAILALGSNDIRVANRVAQLYKAEYAPFIICTGGIAHRGESDMNKPPWEETEAKAYKTRLISLGIPSEVIFLEERATNTGENFSYSQELLEEKNLKCESFILVQKRFSERRLYATARKVVPQIRFCITSPEFSYEEYMNETDKEFPIEKDIFLNVMIGDLQRIKEYPKLGFQIEQEIPDDVWQAGQELIKLGYNKYLIK